MVEIKTSFGAFEAKTHFSNLLDRVEKGDRIVITRHGREVAMLTAIPSTPVATPSVPEMIERALAASKGVKWPKQTTKDLINAGRKR